MSATATTVAGSAARASAGEPPVLLVDAVTKRFSDVVALDGVSVEVTRGELLAVVGPSGCGKSTLLRAIAGLTSIDTGTIRAGGRVVAGPGTWVPPERRAVGVVFQDLALFPHLTVSDNVAFGLGRRASARKARVGEVLDLVGMGRFGRRYPHELSGGEQQRVALARAIAPEPAVVLLDEPFSHLDRSLRTTVREHTVEVLRAAGATCLFVTHDQEEALAVGDRVAVAHDGRLDQVDVPQAVFHSPASRFVATFVGEADFLRGHSDGVSADTALGRLDVTSTFSGRVDVVLRPHEVTFVDGARLRGGESANAVVERTEFRGATVLHHLLLDGGETVRSTRSHTEAVPPGARVRALAVPGHAVAAFPV